MKKILSVMFTLILCLAIPQVKVKAGAILNHTCEYVNEAIPFSINCTVYENYVRSINAGTYYLLDDFNYDSSYGTATITIKKDTTVNICTNGHLFKNVCFDVYGTLNIYDCQDSEHLYNKSSNGKYIPDSNGTIALNGGGMTSKDSGQADGGAFYCHEGSTLYAEGINIVGNDAVNGSAIFANKATVNLKDVNLIGNINSLIISGGKAKTGATLYLNDTNTTLDNVQINNNRVLQEDVKNHCSVYVTGSDNKKLKLKGNTNITNNYINYAVGDNQFETHYTGLVVDSEGNNCIDFDDSFTGSVDVEVNKKLNGSNYSYTTGKISLANNESFYNNVRLFDSDNSYRYYVFEDEDHSLHILDRIKEEPSSSNNNTYKVVEDLYKDEPNSAKYQWYKKTMETCKIEEYVSSITNGTYNNGLYSSSTINGRFGLIHVLNITLNVQTDFNYYIDFDCDVSNLNLRNCIHTGNHYRLKMDPGANVLSITCGSGDAPNGFTISNVKVSYIKATKLEGETSNALQTKVPGKYYCVNSMYKGTELAGTNISKDAIIAILDKADSTYMDITNDGKAYAELIQGNTSNESTHIEGLTLYDVKPNETVNTSINPYENIKLTNGQYQLVYGQDYTLSEGSIKINLNKSYLDTLPIGTDTIDINVVTDNNSYDFNILIKVDENTNNNSSNKQKNIIQQIYKVVDTATK